MGLFLSASGVLSPDGQAVRDAISSFVASTGGTFEPRVGTSDDRNICVIQSCTSTTTVLYPDGFTDWDELSRHLSVELRVPVFSFHIHDGDLWMFVTFADGNDVTRFNPIPDYWEAVGDEERNRWIGSAENVASLVPGLKAAAIAKYFVAWTDDVVSSELKAYDDDEFPIGVDWQLTDFMRRLGFNYPVDQSGTPTGETFDLTIRRSRANDCFKPEPKLTPDKSRTAKPWWKFW